MTPGAEFGVWETTAPPAATWPTLQGPLAADIAIIGAGYTGLATALHLAESGHRPVVLEAREPGWGASGRNTGWLEPNWWLKRPSDIDAMFGRERGAALTRWVASGPQLLQSWIERHGLDVPIDDRGLLMATDQPAKAASLASRGDGMAAGRRRERVRRCGGSSSATCRHGGIAARCCCATDSRSTRSR